MNDPEPNPHATAEQVRAAWSDPKLANVLYHDWEADTYDEKWSISYDERCIDYAVGRFRASAGARRDRKFARALARVGSRSLAIADPRGAQDPHQGGFRRPRDEL